MKRFLITYLTISGKTGKAIWPAKDAKEAAISFQAQRSIAALIFNVRPL